MKYYRASIVNNPCPKNDDKSYFEWTITYLIGGDGSCKMIQTYYRPIYVYYDGNNFRDVITNVLVVNEEDERNCVKFDELIEVDEEEVEKFKRKLSNDFKIKYASYLISTLYKNNKASVMRLNK